MSPKADDEGLDPDAMAADVDLSKASVEDLRVLAARAGIEGAWDMGKADLRRALSEDES